MQERDVVDLYTELERNGITVWIDGGWCVDALLGRQTREHPDLDIAVDRRDVQALASYLTTHSYTPLPKADSSEWNFAARSATGREIDIHVFEYDECGNNVYGIEYPHGSLNGQGEIGGVAVRCISPEWMFKFKTAYAPHEKDLQDVRELAQRYGYAIPDTNRS